MYAHHSKLTVDWATKRIEARKHPQCNDMFFGRAQKRRSKLATLNRSSLSLPYLDVVALDDAGKLTTGTLTCINVENEIDWASEWANEWIRERSRRKHTSTHEIYISATNVFVWNANYAVSHCFLNQTHWSTNKGQLCVFLNLSQALAHTFRPNGNTFVELASNSGCDWLQLENILKWNANKMQFTHLDFFLKICAWMLKIYI